MNESLVKKAIVTYIYSLLNTKYPEYFKRYEAINAEGTTVSYPNVYWANTLMNRPSDATECVLTPTKCQSLVYGIDGKFYKGTDDKYYIEEIEPKILTVNIQVTSMKSKDLGIKTDLQAQNLVEESCSYIENQLKSGSALNYFQYDNEIFTPIEVITSLGDTTDIEDVSIFEDTQARHTCQFSCKFRFSENGSREADVAANESVTLTKLTENLEIEFNVSE